VYQFGAIFVRVVRGLSPLVKTVFGERTKPARFWFSRKIEMTSVTPSHSRREFVSPRVVLDCSLCQAEQNGVLVWLTTRKENGESGREAVDVVVVVFFFLNLNLKSAKVEKVWLRIVREKQKKNYRFRWCSFTWRRASS